MLIYLALRNPEYHCRLNTRNTDKPDLDCIVIPTGVSMPVGLHKFYFLLKKLLILYYCSESCARWKEKRHAQSPIITFYYIYVIKFNFARVHFRHR